MRSKISLLPEYYRKKNRMMKKLYFFITISMTISIILGLVFAFLVIYKISLNVDLNGYRAQRSGINAAISSLKSEQEMRDKIVLLENLVVNIQNNSYDWESFFKKMSATLPAGVSLNSFSASGSKAGGIDINYKGTTKDSYHVALYVQLLKSMPELKNVMLLSSSQSLSGEKMSYSFEIKAKINP